MSTTLAKPGTVERKWYIIDAAGKPLGRTAATAAVLLRGNTLGAAALKRLRVYKGAEHNNAAQKPEAYTL